MYLDISAGFAFVNRSTAYFIDTNSVNPIVTITVTLLWFASCQRGDLIDRYKAHFKMSAAEPQAKKQKVVKSEKGVTEEDPEDVNAEDSEEGKIAVSLLICGCLET